MFQNWQKEKKSRWHNKQNLKLDNSLVVGSLTIQQIYDKYFARLGQQFAVGNSELNWDCASFL